jgi:transcriptional regulator with XRE-family HTH domain
MGRMSDPIDVQLIRARAKVLARGDRQMRKELIQLRREAGLTQAAVAELMGCTQQAVQKLERYDADPKLSTLRRYANAIGALVSHAVEADRGQSVLLESGTAWLTSASTTRTHARVVKPAPLASRLAGTEWVPSSKTTDFALTA